MVVCICIYTLQESMHKCNNVVPEAMSGVVRQVGERGLVDVEHPHILAVAGELERLSVGDGLVDDDARVAPVLLTEHVMADVALALGRHRLPVPLVVSFHGQAPAIARHAGAAAQLPAGAQNRAQGVDQRRRHFFLQVLGHGVHGRHPDFQIPSAARGAANGYESHQKD
ncbi:hypothetical protein PR202_gb24645 [Eleusine coracana subsp. coracana]|uniref:Uncharacterized protein n=1 Tax=Eleusine coracana subsp. coracana TaxID=191504 RepID=A0AAV5FN28_ELECO|nr:hypothetical protein PR202_gb24645 [Eleusine coracana subsp. coracana]